MRKLIMLSLAGAVALAAAPPAGAQTPSGYLLVELAGGGDGGADIEALRSLSLMNCLQLVESLVPHEVIVHLDCNDLDSLSQAVGDFARLEGVARVTVWTIEGGR